MPHPDNNQDGPMKSAWISFPEPIDYKGLCKEIVSDNFDERLQILEEKFDKAFPMRSNIIYLPKMEDINMILREPNEA